MSIYYLISLKPIINRYDWIALLDVDEVIVPRKHKSWSKMMEAVHPQAKDFSRWSFKNIYFLDNMTDNLPEPNLHKDVPAQLHMMNHVYRYLEILSSPKLHPNHHQNDQERQLHPTRALYQVLSQHRACSHPA